MTELSYCSHTQRREHMSGEAMIFISDSITGRDASKTGAPLCGARFS